MQSQIGVQAHRGAFKLCHKLVSPPPSAVLILNWKTNTVITPLATTVALTLCLRITESPILKHTIQTFN